MKLSLSSAILGTLVAPSLYLATAQLAEEVCETTFPHHHDSGDTKFADTVICHADAPWIQLDLSRTQLAAESKLVLVGDSATQELDASALAANGYSAVFDGSCVKLELITPGALRGRGGRGGRGSKGQFSRMVVSAVKAGVCDHDPSGQSICGDTDDRQYSNDVRAGRIGGCTGWLISEDVFIQAGHCGTPSSSARIHFINTSGSAPAEDQYAVDVASYQGINGGVGNDWGAGRLLPNSATGLLPGVAQSAKCDGEGCGWYNLGTVPDQTAGNNIRITGYGTAATDSRYQKTHIGALTTIGSTSLSYVPDTTGGNSGSPVIHEETGDAIGVHTHGGCSATGGSNSGTRIDKSEFAAHVNSLLSGVPSPTPSPTPLPTCNTAKDIKVVVTTDNYPGETSWTLTNNCSGQVVGFKAIGDYPQQNTAFSETFCVEEAKFVFTINDTYGDGICCQYGTGSYDITYGGDSIDTGNGAFGSTETLTFGSCSSDTNPDPTSAPTPNPTSQPTTAPTKQPTASTTLGPTFLTCSRFNEGACQAAYGGDVCQWLGSCRNCGCVPLPQV